MEAKELIQGCLADRAGSWEASEKLALSRLARNPELMAEVSGELIRTAVHYLVRMYSANTRRQMQERIAAPDDASGLAQLASSNVRDWLLFPLQGGLHLGDATRADLLIEIHTHEAMASANAFQARWKQRIVESLPDDLKRVRDVLTSEKIERIVGGA